MNKRAVIQAIIDHLGRELEGYGISARSAHAEATHEQSKAENKYDTRALEASYLARGQSLQAAEIEQSIRQFESLDARKFGAGEAIDVGAVVRLETDKEPLFYFIAPRAGGVEILHGKHEVTVITPQSPIARELIGKKQGDRFVFGLGKSRAEYQVSRIW